MRTPDIQPEGAMRPIELPPLMTPRLEAIPIEGTLEAFVGVDICGAHAVVGRTSDPTGFSIMLSTECANAALAGERVVDIKFSITAGIMAALVVVEHANEGE